nr:immunoglobulin light chain junction region [Macaca mulatta]
CQQDCTALTF